MRVRPARTDTRKQSGPEGAVKHIGRMYPWVMTAIWGWTQGQETQGGNKKQKEG
jgi:hypothetical protein